MNEYRHLAREGERAFPWALSLAGLAIVFAVIVGLMWVFSWGWFSQVTAETRGQTGVRENTVASGQYRIAHYDDFFARCNALVALEGDIEATQQALAQDAGQDLALDRQNLRAQQAAHREQAGQYNARAAAEGTAGQFRDSQLPSHIDPNGTDTTCGH